MPKRYAIVDRKPPDQLKPFYEESELDQAVAALNARRAAGDLVDLVEITTDDKGDLLAEHQVATRDVAIALDPPIALPAPSNG